VHIVVVHMEQEKEPVSNSTGSRQIGALCLSPFLSSDYSLELTRAVWLVVLPLTLLPALRAAARKLARMLLLGHRYAPERHSQRHREGRRQQSYALAH
jgi:hypothetical protein